MSKRLLVLIHFLSSLLYIVERKQLRFYVTLLVRFLKISNDEEDVPHERHIRIILTLLFVLFDNL